jgi:hypothetical protein
VTIKGIIKGKTIELEESLPYSDGQSVNVMVDIYAEQAGLADTLRKVMHESPHLQWVDVDTLEREIEKAKLPINLKGSFDEER